MHGADGIIATIERVLQEQLSKIQNDYLDCPSACQYLGLAKSSLYKLTHRKVIPYYKTGKKIYFKREDLEAYITKYRFMSREEEAQVAKTYCLK